MSLENKLGGNEMVFGFGKKSKKVVSDGPENPDRRRFLKQVKNAGIAAAGAYVGLHVLGKSEALASDDVPGAIRSDPDKKIVDCWWDMKHSRYFEHPYSCDNIEMTKRVMRIHNGISYNGVVETFTPQTSHAYYLVAGKLHYVPIGKIPESNHSLIQFATGIQQFFKSGWSNDKPDYRMASQKFAQGMFLAAMPGQNKEALALASQFMGSDVRGKELILRDVYEKKFKNVRANPKTTDVNSMEYKMLSFYWNYGFFIFAHYNNGNKDDALEIFKSEPYNKLYSKFNFHTASRGLL